MIAPVVGPSLQGSSQPILGNFRILDNAGYEYRTNINSVDFAGVVLGPGVVTFNFDKSTGVTVSDVIVTMVSESESTIADFVLDDVLNNFIVFDVDIIDKNEQLFSCRDVIFACVNQEHPLYEELLAKDPEDTNPSILFPLGENNASVASLEYGINDAIPHSRGGELLCPGNNISEGAVVLTDEGFRGVAGIIWFVGYVGLNNGNGRGGMDAIWYPNAIQSGG